jgi:hypothetical protein
MYIVQQAQKGLVPIPTVSFSSEQLLERDDLQEWLAANPAVLGEPLLIIQKEFDGFDGTSERLDLLALDRRGNLVVIENKTDDSGRDVTWQALKYASYCASLTAPQIIRLYQAYLDKQQADGSAEERLLDFFQGAAYETQLNQGNGLRIMLVAAHFRKEVTSTVLWLLGFNVRLQCHQVRLYRLGEQLLFQIEQIIPLRQTQEYTIQLERKKQEQAQLLTESNQRKQILRRFWLQALPVIRTKVAVFNAVNAVDRQYLTAGSGISLVVYSFSISQHTATVLLNFTRAQASQNEFLYNSLLHYKEQIEEECGFALNWENKPENSSCKISCPVVSIGYADETHWTTLIEQLADIMAKLVGAVKNHLSSAGLAMPTATSLDEEDEEDEMQAADGDVAPVLE